MKRQAVYHEKKDFRVIAVSGGDLWKAQRLSNRPPSREVDKWDDIGRATTFQIAMDRMHTHAGTKHGN